MMVYGVQELVELVSAYTIDHVPGLSVNVSV